MEMREKQAQVSYRICKIKVEVAPGQGIRPSLWCSALTGNQNSMKCLIRLHFPSPLPTRINSYVQIVRKAGRRIGLSGISSELHTLTSFVILGKLLYFSKYQFLHLSRET